jgi:methylated-DNA-[protein]-cysteine S-methyltransferase
LTIEKKIYRALLQVPSGRIITYKELAKSVGLENGQRLIGQIMKKNPFPIIIPCHRVVKSNGDIGGFAFGVNIKKNLLLNEGVKTNKNKIINFEETKFKF